MTNSLTECIGSTLSLDADAQSRTESDLWVIKHRRGGRSTLTSATTTASPCVS
jgi:hypothetical protein